MRRNLVPEMIGIDTPEQLTSIVSMPQRSGADRVARRMLRIPDEVAKGNTRQAERAFQTSMMISAARCTLTYIVLPFLLPLFGIFKSVGPVVGLVIGVVALVCDVFSIRRFFIAEHKYRWHFTVVAGSVMALLSILVVRDVIDLLR
jgi:hypothetical protein